MAMTLDARPNILHHTPQSGTLATPQQQPNVLRTGLTLDRNRVLRPPAGRARGAIQLRPHISNLPDQVRHLTPQLGVAKRSALDAKDTRLDRSGAMMRKDGHPPPKVWCHVDSKKRGRIRIFGGFLQSETIAGTWRPS